MIFIDNSADIDSVEQLARFLQLTTDMVEVGYWKFNIHTKEVFWSPQTFAIHGLATSNPQPSYEEALAYYDTKDQEEISKLVEDSLKKREPFRFIKKITRKDGQKRMVESYGDLEFDVKGEISSLIGTFRDITDITDFTKKLKVSEEKLRLLMRYTPASIAMLDSKMRYLLVSDRWTEAYKLDKDIIGKSHYEIFPEILDMPHWLEIHKQALTGKIFDKREESWIRSDGQREWIEWAIHPWYDKQGVIGGIIIFTEVVTSKKLIQEKLVHANALNNAIFDSANIIMVATDENGIVIQMNKLAEDLLGYSAEEVIGLTTPGIWHDKREVEEKAKELSKKYGEKIKPGFDVFVRGLQEKEGETSEWTFVRKDGSRFTGELIASKILDQKNQVIGYLGLARDITLHKDAQEKANYLTYSLLKSNIDHEKTIRQLDAENAAKNDFLAHMSHEIRTPLNGVIGMANLLSKTGLEQHQVKYLSSLKSSASMLLSVVNDVLEIAKIEAGKLKIENIEFDLHEICTDVAFALSSQAAEKNIKTIFVYPEDMPRIFIGDTMKIRRILFNLYSNAVKFTHKGQISLVAKLDKITGDKIDFSIHIKDTGIGIAKNKIGDIFMPYSQGGASISRQFGGTGLGLPISQDIAQAMGGNIQAKSTLGKGSEFIFSLTLKFRNEKNIKKLRKRTLHKNRENVVTIDRAVDILIVEDNEINLEIVDKTIKAFGFNTRTAINGQEAIICLHDKQPDIILMDCQMPVMDGFEATQLIRSMPELCHIPIIAMTAYALKTDKKRCLDAGMNDYISKPVDDERLQKVLKKWLAKSSQLQKKKNEISAVKKDIEELPMIDVAILNSLKEKMEEDYPRILEAYEKMGLEVIERMILSFERRNLKDIADAAHSFKTASKHMGALKLHHILESIENRIREDSGADVHDLYIQLPNLITLTIESIKSQQ